MSARYLLFLTLFFIIISESIVFAQQDSLAPQPLIVVRDSTVKTKPEKKPRGISPNHSPKKALILSFAIPGAGQIYNRKYWKLPIVYAGLGGLGYLAVSNGSKYSCYRKSYLAMVDDNPFTVNTCDPNKSEADMKVLRDNYQRFYEFSMVGMFAFYVLTAADAFVDAHLMNFDVSDDLSMRIKPSIDISPGFNSSFKNNVMSAGIGLEFNFQNKAKTVNKSFF
jgi:hypothetical protein